MDQELLKEKCLELIRKTKEFLRLKKEQEDSLGVLALIRKTRLSGSRSTTLLPLNIHQLVVNAGSLEEAEKVSASHIDDLKERIDNLAEKIRKLSDEIQPYLAMLPKSPPTVQLSQPPANQRESSEKKDSTQVPHN